METHEFALDVKLNCAIRVKAGSEEAAVAILKEKLDAACANLGHFDNGDPITCEVSLDEDTMPECYEVDGNDPGTKIRPQNRFVVDSCDEDEEQVFTDIVVAESEEAAKEKVMTIRGNYAVVANVITLGNHIQWMKGELKRLQQLRTASDEDVEADWREIYDSHGVKLCAKCNGVIPAAEQVLGDGLPETCEKCE